MTKFLTETDVAEAIGVPEAKAAEYRRRYGWPHLKIGRQIRYTESDLRAIESMHHVSGEQRTGLPDQTARSIARSVR